MLPQRLLDSSDIACGQVSNPRSMATPGSQHGLPLPQRSSKQLSDAVICGPLGRGVPSTVRVLCKHRNSRTLWGGESVGYRRASHTILFSLFDAQVLDLCCIAPSGSQTCIMSTAAIYSITRPGMPLHPLCQKAGSLPQDEGHAPAHRRR